MASFDGIVMNTGFPLPYGLDDEIADEFPVLRVTADGEGGVRVDCGEFSQYLTPKAALEFAAGIEAVAHLAKMGGMAFSGPHLGCMWATSKDVPVGTIAASVPGSMIVIENVGTD